MGACNVNALSHRAHTDNKVPLRRRSCIEVFFCPKTAWFWLIFENAIVVLDAYRAAVPLMEYLVVQWHAAGCLFNRVSTTMSFFRSLEWNGRPNFWWWWKLFFSSFWQLHREMKRGKEALTCSLNGSNEVEILITSTSANFETHQPQKRINDDEGYKKWVEKCGRTRQKY